MMVYTTAFTPPSYSIGPSTLKAKHGNAVYSLAFTSNAHFPCPTAFDSRVTLCFKNSVFYSSWQQFGEPHLNSHGSNGLGVSAVKKRGGKGGVGAVEREDFDDEDDSDYDDEDFVGDDEDDDEGELIPFEQMNKWYKNKPRGFGEGEVYDTSIEDQLLEEIQQSREAQADNLNKLKNDSRNVGSGSNKNEQKKEFVQSQFRVRLANLPKKKNIHRDLKIAFHGIPGIIDIVPAVSGNRKTRDPICKGFAFIDFKCEEDAARFVQLYSKQTIAFGKIQKQIKCDLLNSKSSTAACLESSENVENGPQVMVPSFEEYITENSNIDDIAISSCNVISSDDAVELGKQIYRAEREHVGENLVATAELNVDSEEEHEDDDSVELGFTSETNTFSSKQVDGNGTNELTSAAQSKAGSVPKKKLHSREKKAKKLPKLDIPGSAKRLKIKEKAVLSDVFSKYGSRVGLASKDNQ